MSYNYLIIGNSAAAVGGVEGIRSIDKKGGIALVSSEPYHTYSRPLISYLLAGRTDMERMKYRNDRFYQDHGVDPRLGTAVEHIKEKKAFLADGSEIEFEKVLIATGSRAFVPPVPGLERVKNRFTFLSLDDALALQAAVTKKSRVLIIGSGLIGLKCAEALYGKVRSITLVDLAAHPLPSMLDGEAGELVRAHLAGLGISLILGAAASNYEEKKAWLTNGTQVEFDILCLCVGVRPNIELAEELGAEVNRGIAADEHGRTSIKDVYAAGDCALSLDVSSGERRILALLPNAYMQGYAAGCSMAGGEAAYENAVPMNSMGILGLHMVSAGSREGEKILISTKEGYKAFYKKDGYLCGYVIIGDVARAGIYTSMVRERIPLSEVDFTMIAEEPRLMAFSHTLRKEKLGK